MSFLRLVAGWLLCPTCRTITALLPFADPAGRQSHDVYHRFFRAPACSWAGLFRLRARALVDCRCPDGTLWLALHDTIHRKTGRKMEGAAYYRDPVRSSATRQVYAWGLQVVVLSLRVAAPWGGMPLALPVNFRLHRRGGPTLLELAEEMVIEFAACFPEHRFYLLVDGLYAPRAGCQLPRTHLLSRLRREAVVYVLPPRRQKKRGPPRQKGTRQPAPQEMLPRVRKWSTVQSRERGPTRERRVYSRELLCYQVAGKRPLQLVISLDPTGQEEPDFLFSTDLECSPAAVLSAFADRGAIEETFRSAKQFLGLEEPQCWKAPGPERAAALGYLLYGVVWRWCLAQGYASDKLLAAPWYRKKLHPSFQDALAALRRELWRGRFSLTVPQRVELSKFQETFIHALARAA